MASYCFLLGTLNIHFYITRIISLKINYNLSPSPQFIKIYSCKAHINEIYMHVYATYYLFCRWSCRARRIGVCKTIAFNISLKDQFKLY